MKRIIILQIVLCVSVAAAAADPNLVAWWTFDEGTGMIAYDSAGDNDGQLINEPTWIAGKIGGGLSFDEVDDYIYIPNHPSLNVTTAFTFAFWMYIDEDEIPQGTILSKDGASDTTGAYNIYAFSYRSVGYETNNKYPEIRSEVNSLLPGTWQHIVITFNSSVSPSMRIYIDGLESAAGSPPAPSILSTPLMIGRRGKSTEPWYHNGNLDDVRIYNRALSAEEVQGLYEEGTTQQLTGLEIIGPDKVAEDFTAFYKAIAHYDNGATKDVTTLAEWRVEPDALATIEAGRLTTEQALYPERNVTIYARYTESETTVDAEKQVSILAICPAGTALKFDGQNDYVNVPNKADLNITGDITISAWVWLETGGQRAIVTKTVANGERNNPFDFRTEGVAPHLTLVRADASGHDFVYSTEPISLKQWHHVLVRVENKIPDFYLDGAVTGKTIASFTRTPTGNTKPLLIGRRDDGLYLDGMLDDVRIYNRALSEEEIGEIIFSRPTAGEPNLVAYWDFDQGTGQTATDVFGHGNNGTLGSNSEPDIADPCWVESDAPIGQCTIEQVLVRNLLGATEDKETANQIIADARAKERASLELIEELRRQTRGQEQRAATRAKTQIHIALLQEQMVSRLIDATTDLLEDALRLLGYQTDANSVP